jgi:predicted nucleotidyltransferase
MRGEANGETAGDAAAPRERYERAVAALVEGLAADRMVLAVILCGSLSHDEVWEKSDVDLVVVTTDDLKENASRALVADGINVHAYLASRTRFKALVQGGLQGSFLNSFLSLGKILFARDESIDALFGTLGHLGSRDRQIAMLKAAMGVFPALDKAEKWLYAKRDPRYCFFWIMKMVDGLSALEVLHHGGIPSREAVQQARRLNPDLVRAIYDDPIDGPKSVEAMEAALRAVREHLLLRDEAFAPILRYLEEADGLRGATEISHDFRRQWGLESVDGALEWLADQGIIRKLSTPCRLTPKSRVSVEEAAYTL